MTQHCRPETWKHCISGNSGNSDEDEKHEIEEEHNLCENCDEGTPVAIWEVVYEGGGCACAHDDCVPCGSEMSVGVVNDSGQG